MVDHEYLLRGLLAVIHRDGGHYTAEHGIKKSVDDARALVLRERVTLDEERYRCVRLVEEALASIVDGEQHRKQT